LSNKCSSLYIFFLSVPANFAHLCDGPAEIPNTKEGLIHTGRDERLYVGEGGIPISDIVKNLPEDITFSIELPNLKSVEVLGNAEHARRCLQSAKDYLAKHIL
jgi:sugar phosphate isomerase/epimerase